MELQVPAMFLVASLLFLFMLLTFTKKSNPDKRLPPGPFKLPFIGSLWSVVSSKPPQHVITKLARKHGPLMHLQLGEISALVISSSRLAREILSKKDLSFANRPQLVATKIAMYNNIDIGFSPYGTYYKQMRKICTMELLSAKKVQTFSYIREEEVNNMIESIRSSVGSPFNLTTNISMLVNTITSRAAFGKIYKDQDVLVEKLQEMASLISGLDFADVFPSYKFLHVITGLKAKMTKIHKDLDKIFNNILEEHGKDRENSKGGVHDKEDLADILIRLKDSGALEVPISTDNIKAVILDMYSAGTDAATMTLEWVMSELIRNPKVLKKATEEVRQVINDKDLVQETDLKRLNYVKLVIKETMRLHPAVPLLLPRECRESCEIDGYVIPVGTQVMINAFALGRDPEYWPDDPECFKPERFENTSHDFIGTNMEYLPFGAGRRSCPGSLFGVAILESVLSSLLYHFDWKLPAGMKPEDLDMTETFGIACRRKIDLELMATPYTRI